MNDKELTILKQVAAKLTSFGFPSDPYPKEGESECEIVLRQTLAPAVEVWEIKWLAPPHPTFVYALVVLKGHKPAPAYHVVDFRVGSNIYGDS